jgi:transposase
MEARERFVAPPGAEVHEMIEPEVVRQVRVLSARGWGAKRIAGELGIARNTVRRYLRGGHEAEQQVRPRARRLDEDAIAEAKQMFVGLAEGNAVVVRRELARRGIEASLRTVQRAVAEERRLQRVADVASVRFETPPGKQMQIDFGQKRVPIGGVLVRVHLMAAVLSYSRRVFVRAFLAERGDDWREGIADAFRHFGGVVRVVLGDNAKALVVERNRETCTVQFHPAYLAFCRDWGVEPRACAPYRARTKGKVESGVKYVKRNALAGRSFNSFHSLEEHLREWMFEADHRVHGTTFERPIDRFERDEACALRPLPALPMPVRQQRLVRRVANDAFVDVDTVRYSVPHRLVRERVEVALGESEVRIFHGTELVAVHHRSFEPHDRVRDPSHFKGLWRDASAIVADAAPTSGLAAYGRSLRDYEAVLTAEVGR